jgi:hypothetical protein
MLRVRHTGTVRLDAPETLQAQPSVTTYVYSLVLIDESEVGLRTLIADAKTCDTCDTCDTCGTVQTPVLTPAAKTCPFAGGLEPSPGPFRPL